MSFRPRGPQASGGGLNLQSRSPAARRQALWNGAVEGVNLKTMGAAMRRTGREIPTPLLPSPGSILTQF